MPISFTCPHCGKNTEVEDHYAGLSGPCAACGQTITIPGSVAKLSAKAMGAASATQAGSSSAGMSVTAIVAIALVCTCLGGGGVMVALLLPAVQSAREAARRMQCSNNLKQIGLALHNYHDVHKCFPAAFISDANGKPAHSWRVAILPYIEQSPLYDRYNFDEPWDSPDNQVVANDMPNIFACPSSPPQPGMTSYVVIIGDPNKFPETLFTGDRWMNIAKITDGTSSTIAVVEVATPVPWTKPDADLKYRDMNFRVGSGPNSISSQHSGGAQVLFADGSVQFISNSTPDQTIQLMIQPADGQPVVGR